MIPNDHEIDAIDLVESLEITNVERRTSAGGVWVQGTIGGHRFDALVFPEHAVEPDYELNESRISKLWLQRIDDGVTAMNFDRGWDLQPATPMAQRIVDLLCEGLADTIYS